jgi:hypothetical protein
MLSCMRHASTAGSIHVLLSSIMIVSANLADPGQVQLAAALQTLGKLLQCVKMMHAPTRTSTRLAGGNPSHSVASTVATV